MTRDEAKRTLSLFRPWTNDAEDPEFAEALALTRQDAELGRWFAQHCAAQSAVRAGLKNISPPAALKEQIISEHKARVRAAKWRKPQTLAAMVCGLLILVALGVWLMHGPLGESEAGFARYRSRMVKAAQRAYVMDLETNSAPVIRAFLAQHQASSNYVLPKSLAIATNTGCGVLKWQGNNVAMVCFHSGRPLAPGQKTDLFLFVMNRNAAPDAPTEGPPQFAQVNNLVTASWTQDGMVYLLAAPGNEEFLKKFL
jgi:hypothetical protein